MPPVKSPPALSSDIYDARISYDGRYVVNTIQHGGQAQPALAFCSPERLEGRAREPMPTSALARGGR